MLLTGLLFVAVTGVVRHLGTDMNPMQIAKKLTETESSASIVAYMSVFVTLALLLPALLVWRTPTLTELGWLFVTAGRAL
jgi:hypothetical protein